MTLKEKDHGQRDGHGKYVRWQEYLNHFNHETQHIPRKKNVVFDYLSRKSPSIFMQNLTNPLPNPGFLINKEFDVHFRTLNPHTHWISLLKVINTNFQENALHVSYVGCISNPVIASETFWEFSILRITTNHQYLLLSNLIRKPFFTWPIICISHMAWHFLDLFTYVGPDQVNPDHTLNKEIVTIIIIKKILKWESFFSPQLFYETNLQVWNVRHKF